MLEDSNEVSIFTHYQWKCTFLSYASQYLYWGGGEVTLITWLKPGLTQPHPSYQTDGSNFQMKSKVLMVRKDENTLAQQPVPSKNCRGYSVQMSLWRCL